MLKYSMESIGSHTISSSALNLQNLLFNIMIVRPIRYPRSLAHNLLGRATSYLGLIELTLLLQTVSSW